MKAQIINIIRNFKPEQGPGMDSYIKIRLREAADMIEKYIPEQEFKNL